MNTLRLFSASPPPIPPATAWYLSDLGEARGRQELFLKQSPQRLDALKRHALVESAVSSNRMEGVTVDRARVNAVIFGKSLLRDRDEEEVRGYRDALRLIHEKGAGLEISEKTVHRLHALARRGVGDAGKYKAKDSDIIEKYPDGKERVRFKTVPAARTPAGMKELVALWRGEIESRIMPPLVVAAAWNLDFLCIHPFRDGNGRVSRLLLLLQCYHLGFDVGRYISIERLIEQNKDLYYEALERSSKGWHDSRHNPWPYVNFILCTLKDAYKELDARASRLKAPRGAKTAFVQEAMAKLASPFTLADLRDACPSVSADLVRRTLRMAQQAGKVECLGHGPGAKWRRRGNTLKRG